MSEAFGIVRKFEKTIADYCGSRYGVAIDSCTNALLLCCKYLDVCGVTIPKRTYIGVANSIYHAGGIVMFDNRRWKGAYQLKPYPIYDSALRFKKDMYIKDSYYCLSFNWTKKHIPIGKGGMILTNDKKAVNWFKQMRFDGRKECTLHEDNVSLHGYNMYMLPEQAARGLMLFERIKNKDLPDIKRVPDYPDISKWEVFK